MTPSEIRRLAVALKTLAVEVQGIELQNHPEAKTSSRPVLSKSDQELDDAIRDTLTHRVDCKPDTEGRCPDVGLTMEQP